MVTVLRDITLVCSGEIAGKLQRAITYVGIEPDDTRETNASGSVSTPWGSVDWNTANFPDIPYLEHAGWEVRCTDAAGGTAYDRDDTLNYNGSITHSAVDNLTDGSYTISAVCEVCIEHLPVTTTDDEDYFPDPPVGDRVRIFFRTKIGGAYTAEIYIHSATASSGGSFSTAVEIPLYPVPDAITAAVQGTSYRLKSENGDGYPPFYGADNAGFSQCTVEYRDASLSTSVTYSDDYGQASASGDTVSVTPKSKATNVVLGTANASMTIAPQKTYTLDTVIRAMEDAYPGDPELIWSKKSGTEESVTANGGAWSGGYSQKYEVADASTTGGAATHHSLTEFAPISVRLDPEWCEEAEEPGTDLAVILKDRKMGGLSVSHALNYSLPSGTETVISTPGASGRKRSWSSGDPDWISLQSYRFLRIRVRDSSSMAVPLNFTLRIRGYEWTSDKNGVSLKTQVSEQESCDHIIDLCAPSNKTEVADARDTTFPYEDEYINTADMNLENPAKRTGEGPFTGPNWTHELEVVGDGLDGSDLTFEVLELVRLDSCRLTLLPPFFWTEQRPKTYISEAGTTTEHSARQFMNGVVDGRANALEETDTIWDHTETGEHGVVINTLYRRTIADVVSYLNDASRNVGWTGSAIAPADPGGSCTGPPGPPAHDCYYNRMVPSDGICGGGALWNGSEWEYGFDLEVSDEATSFDWQGGYTTVDFPGNLGDIFQHADSSQTGSTTLKGAKILRGQAHGLILNQRRRSADNVPVAVIDVDDDTEAGEATSDELGYFLSRLPYARGERSHNVSVQAGPSPRPAATTTFYPRKRQRFTLRTFQVCMGLMPGLPLTYFPFSPQFSDANLLPLEDWRRIPAAGGTGNGGPDGDEGSTNGSVTTGSRSGKAGQPGLLAGLRVRRKN